MASVGDTPIYDYGNKAGPTSKFQAFIGLKITGISDTQYRLSYNHAIYTTTTSSSWATVRYTGKLNGSTVWSGSASLGKTGWYADNGWIDLGWYSSGQTVSLSMTANYTGGSGTYYESSVSNSYTVPQLKQAPAAATSCTLTESTANTTGTFSWVASGTTSAPIENQEWCYQVDGGEWVYAKTGNGTTRSVTLSLTTNAQYRCAIQMENSVGQSSWVYSNYIYTKPSKPSSLVGMNTGEYVNLTVTNTARWHSTNKWQVSLDGGSTYSNVSGTGTTLKYTIDTTSTNTNVLEPKFRCASLNAEGDQSDWIYCTPVKRISVYVWCPEGKTISGIYINDGAVT